MRGTSVGAVRHAVLPVLVLVAVFVASDVSAAHAAGWSRPFRITRSLSQDLLAPQVAFSPGSDAAIVSSLQNPDKPWISNGVLAIRSAGGVVGPTRRVPGAQEVLAVSYASSTVELLTGSSPSSQYCCATIQLVPFSGGRFGPPQTLLRGLLSGAVGELVTLPGQQLLAAVANSQAVWAEQSPAGASGPVRRLTPRGAMPQSLGAAVLGGGRGAVAWTATTEPPPYDSPRAISLATGSSLNGPAHGRTALRAASGHQIDQLALGSGTSGATAAWIDSWFDNAGYHSQAAVGDLGPHVVREFPLPGAYASDPSLASDGQGNQVLTWKACNAANQCAAAAVTRRPHKPFSSVQVLGKIDPSQAPVAAVGPGGLGLVGFVSGGHVFAASHGATAGAFSRPLEVSNTSLASQLTITFGPANLAVAAWVQGTSSPALFGASFSTGSVRHRPKPPHKGRRQ